MILRQIKLENFLSHENVDLRLPESGTFLLTGKSGIGKSSLIIDAVAYSLYGAVATRGKKQVDLRNNDDPGAAMTVETVWQFDDQLLTFARGIDKRNGSWAKVYGVDDQGEGVILAEGIKPVARLVLQRMGGMNWQQFYSAFVARQAEINLLTTLKGAQRKELIHRMLGMRELEKAEQIITAKLRRSRSLADQLEKSVGGIDLLQEERKLVTLKEAIKQLQGEIKTLKKKIETQEKEKKQTQDQQDKIEEAIRELAGYENLENKIKILDQSIASIKQIAEEHAQASQQLEGVAFDQLEKDLDDLKLQREELRKQFTNSKKLIKVEAEQEALNTELHDLCADAKAALDGNEAKPAEGYGWKEMGAWITSLEKSNQDIGEQITVLEDQLYNLQENDQCFICQRPFADQHDHESIIREIEKSRKEKRETVQSQKRLIDTIKKNKNLFEKIDQLEEERKDKDREYDQLRDQGAQGDLRKIETEGNQLAANISDREENLARYRQLEKQINKKVFEQFRDQTGERDRLQTELQGKAAPDPDLKEQNKNLADRIAEIDIDLAAQRATLNQLEQSLRTKKTDRDNQDRLLQGHQHEFSELARIEKETEVAETTTLVVRGYQKHLTNEIRPALEEIASEMIARISEGRHVAIRINDQYEISVEKASGAVLPASLLSGGEEIRANICLRLALTRLVSQRTGVPVGFLILDEPLPAQDADHVEKIMELLQSLRPFYQQQFIISHVGELRSDDSVDYIIDFDRNESGRTEVRLINA